MKFHECANIFPMMEHADMLRLAEDIKAKGQAEPIVTFENQILDGRNRYKACITAGIKPVTVEYTGNDPLGFVVSHNLHRRHLDEGQRGMVAAKIADMPHGGTVYSPPKSDGPNGPSVPRGKSNAEAAEMMNVSERTVKRAKRVINSGIPELQDMVTSGEVNVTTAEKVSTLPAPQQRKAVQGGVAGVKAAAKQEPAASAQPKRKPPIKIIEHEGERIWMLAKGHLDRIGKHDVHRVKVLNECISYCMNRLKTNK